MTTIRCLTSSDYASFLPLIKEFRDTNFTEQEFRDRLYRVANSGCYEIWVIEDPETKTLVATATLFYEYKFIFNLSTLAHIEDVCVSARFRGQGYGKLICQHLVERARKNGCYKVTLDCSAANEEFYTKCGFKTSGKQMVQFLDDHP
jgi:glucosamine-phosphate N-acetyltransferase